MVLGRYVVPSIATTAEGSFCASSNDLSYEKCPDWFSIKCWTVGFSKSSVFGEVFTMESTAGVESKMKPGVCCSLLASAHFYELAWSSEAKESSPEIA